MLAARGIAPKIMHSLLDAIGKDRIHQELQRTDNKGRTVADWGNMNLQALWDEFMAVGVDSEKAANYCNNVLSGSDGEDHRVYLQGAKRVEEARRLGFDVGPAIFQSDDEMQMLPAFTATKNNVEKLLQIAKSRLELATNKGPTANKMREFYEQLFWPTVSDPKQLVKNWKGFKKEMGRLISIISSDNLLSVYSWNQDHNGFLIREFANPSLDHPTLDRGTRLHNR
jgi:hypothetical protein